MTKNLKIVVSGGSGLIGKQVVALLNQQGHETVAASPSRGVNAITGEGLAAALTDAQVIVDVSNSPSFENKAVLEFFERSTRNLVAGGKTAGLKHFVALSVVGADRLPDSGYFQAKLVQENLIKSSGLPYTIVRATQFFEFIKAIADSLTQGQSANVPPARMQPIAAADVAAAVAEVAVNAPVNGIIEIAGPEAKGQDTLVRQLFQATGDARTVVTDPKATYFGAAINDQSLTPTPGAKVRLGKLRFEDWLKTAKT
ncbi:MAG TPA: NAD(P)H-binding protein [Verrucomicrobiae bacterium]|nr:NAD(P)H-binding protein [Verrucomicrobiae bacterium]